MEAPASCSLDADGLAGQRERYRQAGAGARVVERSRRRLVVRLGDGVEDANVQELMAVERECCPFFALSWDGGSRLFTASVARPEDERALDGLACAFGVEPAQPAAFTVWLT